MKYIIVREISRLLRLVIFLGVLGFGLYWLSGQVLGEWRNKNKLETMNNCAQAYRVSYKTPEGGEVTEVFQAGYDRCLKDRGIR